MFPSKHLQAVGQMPLGRFVTTYRSDYKPSSEYHPQVNRMRPQKEARAVPAFVKRVWPLVGEVEKGRRHKVFGENANVLELQEAKDEPQEEIDILYKEGVIVFSSHVCPACCEVHIRYACRDAGLQHLLHLPVASSPIITFKDAGNLDYFYFRGLSLASGLKNSTFLQSTTRQCSCCAWKTDSCCFKMQSFPPGTHHGSTLPLAHVQAIVNYRKPSRKPLLTEYQANYTAEWAQPQIQQCDFHRLRSHAHHITDHV